MSPSDMLDALLALPKLGSSAVSPDGQWVAWIWAGVRSTRDVYLAPANGDSAPIALTASDQDVDLVAWTPDSTAIIVGQDCDGDERVQLFRVDLDNPGELVPLTEPAPSYFLHGGQLHPNSRFLVYAMNYDVETCMEIEPTWIYRHDLETDERVPLARPCKPAYVEPDLNDAGTHVLYERRDLDPAGSQIWLVDIDGCNDREILNFGPKAEVTASWFPDSTRILFLADGATHRRLGVWNLKTEAVLWLIDDPDRNIEHAFVPRGTESATAVTIEIKQARAHATLLQVETGVERALPGIPGALVPSRRLSSGEWIGQYYSSTHPADLIRFQLETESLEAEASITRLWERTPLTRHDLCAARDFRWRSVDGLEIQGWLYRPQGSPLGTIVHVHGGPTSHTEDSFMPMIQFFVAAGFNVLSPNYRGSTGFGLPFEEAIKVDGWGGREQDDIRTGIEALIAAGVAEAGKVGITGTSYGGYSSWCAITRYSPDIIAAAAPICGMTDLVVDYETTRPDLRPYSEEMMGGPPEKMPERYYERSPIHFVDRIRGDLLIVQGLRDPNVTPQNVLAVRKALDSAGIPYEVLVFEDEGHGITRPKNQRILYRRLSEFFVRAFARPVLLEA